MPWVKKETGLDAPLTSDLSATQGPAHHNPVRARRPSIKHCSELTTRITAVNEYPREDAAKRRGRKEERSTWILWNTERKAGSSWKDELGTDGVPSLQMSRVVETKTVFLKEGTEGLCDPPVLACERILYSQQWPWRGHTAIPETFWSCTACWEADRKIQRTWQHGRCGLHSSKGSFEVGLGGRKKRKTTIFYSGNLLLKPFFTWIKLLLRSLYENIRLKKMKPQHLSARQVKNIDSEFGLDDSPFPSEGTDEHIHVRLARGKRWAKTSHRVEVHSEAKLSSEFGPITSCHHSAARHDW